MMKQNQSSTSAKEDPTWTDMMLSLIEEATDNKTASVTIEMNEKIFSITVNVLEKEPEKEVFYVR